ncbi:MAG: hypothetical protein ACYCOS_06270 [Sulfobacillus sp.]
MGGTGLINRVLRSDHLSGTFPRKLALSRGSRVSCGGASGLAGISAVSFGQHVPQADRDAAAAKIDAYNADWLLKRHGHQTPNQVWVSCVSSPAA